MESREGGPLHSKLHLSSVMESERTSSILTRRLLEAMTDDVQNTAHEMPNAKHANSKSTVM